MSKREISKNWSAISAADQAYLRESYDRFKSRFLSPPSANTTNISFEHWLSKRGIRKLNPQ
jgi:hypothetical protein